MNTTSLVSSMSSLSFNTANGKSFSSNSVPLSSSTSPIACADNIETKESQEQLAQIRQLAAKILGSSYSSFKLPYLLHAARKEIEQSRLIMVGKGMKIYDTDTKLNVGCLEGLPRYLYHDVKKASFKDMSAEIAAIVEESRKTFRKGDASAPEFDEKLLQQALDGKDPTIIAFSNALKANSKLIESIEKVCMKMQNLMAQMTGESFDLRVHDSALSGLDFNQGLVIDDLNNGLKMVTSRIRIWAKEAKIFRIDVRHQQGIKCWLEEKCCIPLGSLEKAEKTVSNILKSFSLRNNIDIPEANFDKSASDAFQSAMQDRDPTILAFTNTMQDYPTLFL